MLPEYNIAVLLSKGKNRISQEELYSELKKIEALRGTQVAEKYIKEVESYCIDVYSDAYNDESIQGFLMAMAINALGYSDFGFEVGEEIAECFDPPEEVMEFYTNAFSYLIHTYGEEAFRDDFIRRQKNAYKQYVNRVLDTLKAYNDRMLPPIETQETMTYNQFSELATILIDYSGNDVERKIIVEAEPSEVTDDEISYVTYTYNGETKGLDSSTFDDYFSPEQDGTFSRTIEGKAIQLSEDYTYSNQDKLVTVPAGSYVMMTTDGKIDTLSDEQFKKECKLKQTPLENTHFSI